jgi:hypothetical protein
MVGLIAGKLIGANDDLFGLERTEFADPDSRVEGLRFQDFAGQEKLLRQLLVPLLAEIRRDNDQDATLPLGPLLGEHEAGLDGLAETNLVREQGTLESGELKAKSAAST